MKGNAVRMMKLSPAQARAAASLESKFELESRRSAPRYCSLSPRSGHFMPGQTDGLQYKDVHWRGPFADPVKVGDRTLPVTGRQLAYAVLIDGHSLRRVEMAFGLKSGALSAAFKNLLDAYGAR